MIQWLRMGLAGIMLLGLFSHTLAFTTPTNGLGPYTVQSEVTVDANTPSITLNWLLDASSTEYVVYRKPVFSSWGSPIATLSSTTDNYTDTDVDVGTAYEYHIEKQNPLAWGGHGHGYIYSGIEIPLQDEPGAISLIVDQTIAAGIATELTQFTEDLVGEGWHVLRHDVSRSEEPSNIQALIRGDYGTDNTLASVVLVGHVPVPYSGDIYPDGHVDHRGAWPADMYYGDLSNIWTDTSVNITSATDSRNDNVPGDGKFDRSLSTEQIQLGVGRIDMYDLPAFVGETETTLLARYFDKNHAYRFKGFVPNTAAVISDTFGALGEGGYSASAWSGFSTLVGGDNITSLAQGDYLETISTGSFMWSYGSGSGTYTSASNIANTNDLAANPVNSVFTMLLGSYFGDWDITNNFLRAAIAGEGYSLASMLSGTPLWFVHHMALGKPIGYSARITQNNPDGDGLYETNAARGVGEVHVALMGDPTLRMHVVAPAENLTASSTADGIELSWGASDDVSVLGYHVYASNEELDGYERLTDDLVEETEYLDETAVGATTTYYMVRAVKLEETPSGSYFNASQGIFGSELHATYAPQVSTEDVSSATQETLTLEGTIESVVGENATTHGFEYGTSVPYTATTSESGSFGVGNFSLAVSGLSCGTTYHFRAWAENSIGVGYGTDTTAVTDACEEEEEDSGGGGGGGGGGGSSRGRDEGENPLAPTSAGSVLSTEARAALIITLRSLIEQFVALGGAPSSAMLAFLNAPTVFTPTAPSSNPNGFTRDLQFNDTGTDVRMLQELLIKAAAGPKSQELGLNGVTGFFGSLTQAALSEYQASRGIYPASGYFGARTRAVFVE